MTYYIDLPSKADAIAKAFNLIVSYRTRGSALDLLVFLEVAREDGCTSRHLQERLNINQSTVSRVTRVLGEGKAKASRRQTWDGKGLIFSYKDGPAMGYPLPAGHSLRADRFRYSLTDKGHELLETVADYLSRHFPSRPFDSRQ